jgi:hypothetical protein
MKVSNEYIPFSRTSLARNFPAGALFFNLLATLIDVVPLGTFSSRESAVEWISDGKSHHTPIVLSPVVIEQCKLLLVDSFVRNLFNCADSPTLGTEEVLRAKNDKDLKHEKDLAQVRTSSAASLAAKEARVDRSKGFWQSSKWARKLTSGVVRFVFVISVHDLDLVLTFIYTTIRICYCRRICFPETLSLRPTAKRHL